MSLIMPFMQRVFCAVAICQLFLYEYMDMDMDMVYTEWAVTVLQLLFDIV